MSKIMANIFKSPLLIIAFFATHNPVFALESDNQKPLELKANTADINQSEHKGVYTNGIEFDQGTTHIRADKAITKTDANNKLIEAIIYGDTKNQAHYWSQMEKDKPDLHAFANIIKYYPESKIIKLIGNARVSQGENLFTAPKITYNIAKRHIISCHTKDDTQKTVIIFNPPRKK